MFNNLRKRTILTLCLLVLGWQTALGQNDWQYRMYDPDENYFELKAEVEDYFSRNPHLKDVKGSGWKKWQRFAWLSESRVGPDGTLNDALDAMREFAMVPKPGCNNQQGIPTWRSLGPHTPPVGGSAAGKGVVAAIAVDPNDASLNTIYAGSNSGGLFKTTNGGSTWFNITDSYNFPGMGIADILIDPNNSNIIYIATGVTAWGRGYGNGVLKTTDGGASWSTTGLSYTPSQKKIVRKLKMDPNNSSVIYALTPNTVYRSSDAGATFTNIGSFFVFGTSPGMADMEVRPGDGNTLYVSSHDRVFKTTNAGTSWTNFTNNIPNNSSITAIKLAVSESEPNSLWALYVNDDIVYFAKSSNLGNSFAIDSQQQNLIQDEFLLDRMEFEVSPLNSDRVYAGGVQLWRTVDGNSIGDFSQISQWTPRNTTTFVHADVRDMLVVEHSDGSARVIVGCDGGVFIEDDDPSTTKDYSDWDWDDISGSYLDITQFYGIDILNESTLVLGGTQDCGTNRYLDGDWENLQGGDGGRCLINYNDADVMFSAPNAKFNRSVNGGVNWNEVTPPNAPSGEYWNFLAFPMFMSAVDPDHVFVAYRRVYISTNSGLNWNEYSPSVAPHRIGALELARANEDYGYFATNEPDANGAPKIWRTQIGTSGWEATDANLPDFWGNITDIAANEDHPKHVWVTVGGFSSGNKVFFSSDAGNSWTNISTGLPNLPVNTIAYQEGSEYMLYAGTDGGVYYWDGTLTSGEWRCYNNGMPTVIISDLKINYCAGKLVGATYGRGLFEVDLKEALAIGAQSINSNTTWSGYQHLKNDLTILSGKTLTVTGTVNIARNVKIYVQAGARLVVDGGTLTNQCGAMWGGIEVWGNKNLSQLPLNNSPQGYAEFKNGAVVENALTAVQLAKSNDQNATGGLVIAEESTFRNNRTAVNFVNYRNYLPGTSPKVYVGNASRFTDCDFITDKQLNDPDANPFAFVSMWKVDGLRFIGCRFQNTSNHYASADRGKGIYSVDGDYDVYGLCTAQSSPCPAGSLVPCEFSGLYAGIHAEGSNPLYTISASDAEFADCFAGILAQGQDYAEITGCKFDVDEFVGLYLDGCSDYLVERNTFHSVPANAAGLRGLIARSSGSKANKINNNEFIYMDVALLAWEDNDGPTVSDGLQMLCNSFTHCAYDIYVKDGDIALHQGACLTPASTANNDFSNLCAAGPHRDYFVSKNSAQLIWYHAIPGTGPLCPNPNYVIELPCVARDVPPGSSPDCGPIGACDLSCLSQYLDDADDAIDSVGGTINAGRTQELLDLITQDASDSEVYLAYSTSYPHSDEVLLAAIEDKPTPLSVSTLHDILIPDAPLTAQLMAAVSARDQNLANSITLYGEQNGLQISERGLLEMEIAHHEKNRSAAAAGIVRLLLEDEAAAGGVAYAITFLQGETGIEAQRDLLAAYLRDGEYASAQILVNLLRAQNDPGLANYLDLQETLINAYQAEDDVFSLQTDSEARLLVESIANSGGQEQEVRNARAIMSLVFGVEYPIEIPLLDGPAKRAPEDNAPEAGPFKSYDPSANLRVAIVPNPNEGVFDLRLDVSGREPASVVVSDMLGREVYRKTGITASGKLKIDIARHGRGNYLLKVEQDAEALVLSVVVR